jgi:hypothetical protein
MAMGDEPCRMEARLLGKEYGGIMAFMCIGYRLWASFYSMLVGICTNAARYANRNGILFFLCSEHDLVCKPA